MTTALVLDSDAVSRHALTDQLRALGLTTMPCADADEARQNLTTSLFDIVLYRCPQQASSSLHATKTERLLRELAICPTPLVALADEHDPVEGVAAWLPASPDVDELDHVVRAHAIDDPFGPRTPYDHL